MMENITLIEKTVLVPEKPTENRSIFLSNIDLGLVTYQESVAFFDPPPNQMSFSETCQKMKLGTRKLLVAYDFLAGRLRPSAEDGRRLEIDCNCKGLVFVSAVVDCELSQLGNLMEPKPQFKHLVKFLREENEEHLEINELPVLSIQLTEFKCGSIVLGSRYNHCVMDGIAVCEFESNMAALTRGEDLTVVPNPDRTIFKARIPPLILYSHSEYSKGTDADNLYTIHCKDENPIDTSALYNQTHLIYLSPEKISKMKKAALCDGRLKHCSIFDVVAAKIWKARSIAVDIQDEEFSTMLFPVDVRKRVVPQAPIGFAGNALIPGFARATMREIKEEDDYVLIKKVQEGIERLNNEYVRSSIDWLEVNKGVPCRENSFSLVAWWRLGLENNEFAWGGVKCTTPVVLKPGLVFLLPGLKHEGGLNICLALPNNQVQEFERLVMED